MSYGDSPIGEPRLDWLGRAKAVEVLRTVLTAGQLDTPLVVGVYGGWGTGKTSVMQLLKGKLPEDSLKLWFDAWKYSRQDEALWRALLLAVIEALGNEHEGLARSMAPKELTALKKDLDELATSLYRSQALTERGDLRVNWGALLPLAADMALRFATLGKLDLSEVVGKLTGEDAKKAMRLVERERATRYREQVTSLEQFHIQLKILVEREVVARGRRLFLFVDDLDRCLPEDAVGAIEAIKLFLDLPGCVFVFGMDRSVVEQGIRVRYQAFALAPGQVGPVDARQYLDKVIQIPFNLPPLSPQQMKSFIESWCRENAAAELTVCAELIASGVAPNPRTVKKTLNVLRLTLELEGAGDRVWTQLEDKPVTRPIKKERVPRLAKIVVLQTSYEDLYHKVAETPSVLKFLEKMAREPEWKAPDMPPHLKQTLEKAPRLKQMLKTKPYFDPLEEDQLAELVYVSEVVM